MAGILLHDLSGEKVYSIPVKELYELDLSGIKPGIYYYFIQTAEGRLAGQPLVVLH
jgi:hypothetical protein